MVTLEGIAIGIEPNFKVLSKAYPYVAKRLLTDPSPELRSSLKDLLFNEGSFRWNRLENLLRNAKNSPDYDFDGVVNQGVDFLFSERGSFIRDKLVDEVVNGLDIFGRKTWFNFSTSLRETVGLAVQQQPLELKNSSNGQTMTHLTNIWQILEDTPGFDSLKLLPVLAQLLQKSETQQLGQKIASGLAQKAAARLIRNFLLDSENGFNSQPQLSLPKAAMR